MAAFSQESMQTICDQYSVSLEEAQRLLDIYAMPENVSHTVESIASIIGQGTEPGFMTTIVRELIHNQGNLDLTIDYLTREVKWMCEICTYENQHIMQGCGMCGTPMPSTIPTNSVDPQYEELLQNVTGALTRLAQPLNTVDCAWIIITGNQYGHMTRCDCDQCLATYITTAMEYVASVDPENDTNVQIAAIITETIIPSILTRFLQRNMDLQIGGGVDDQTLQEFIDSTLSQESKCNTATDETLDMVRSFTINKTMHQDILDTIPRCAICISDVVEGDAVIQLPCCKQLFHPGGSDSECQGLVEYIKGHNSACPCCRKDINESLKQSD
jgi:hypothetical protein